jgi:hypothetical protein
LENIIKYAAVSSSQKARISTADISTPLSLLLFHYFFWETNVIQALFNIQHNHCTAIIVLLPCAQHVSKHLGDHQKHPWVSNDILAQLHQQHMLADHYFMLLLQHFSTSCSTYLH